MLVNDLKKLITDLKEQELDAKKSGNTGMESGLMYARINLETVLSENGHFRPSTIENSHDVLIEHCS